MHKYYLNPDTTSNPHNNNEIHKEGCYCMPSKTIYMGTFNNCIEAVAKAKREGYPAADGCAHCCPEANTD